MTTKGTTDQEMIDLLRTTLRDVAEGNGDYPITATERMRAALALAQMGDAVAEDETPLLRSPRIDSLRKIINGETD